MCFLKHPFLLRTIHQTKIQIIYQIFLQKRWTQSGFQYRHFQGSCLENQLHSTSNTQSVCLAYVLISPNSILMKDYNYR